MVIKNYISSFPKLVFTANTGFYLYNFRIDLMYTLVEKGYKIYALTPEDKYSEILSKNFFYHKLHFLQRRGLNPIKDFQLFLEFIKVYKTIKPSLVINFTIKPNIYSSLACSILKIPTISVITGLGYVFIHSFWLKNLVKILYKIAFKRNKFIVVQNTDDYAVISKLSSSSKVILIPGSGVNTSFFCPVSNLDVVKGNKIKNENNNIIANNSARNLDYPFYEKLEKKPGNFFYNCNLQYSIKYNKNCFIFLFIGRFLVSKGILELIEASQYLISDGFKFELWLLGDVDNENPASITYHEIERIKKLEYVKILPFTNDIRPYLDKADCVVLPSYREGIPMVLLEAMAMEKPIVTTNAVGCKELILDGVNGFVASVKDSISLYKAMRKIIQLPCCKLIEMGKNGRKIVLEKYDENKVIPMFIDLIEKTLSK